MTSPNSKGDGVTSAIAPKALEYEHCNFVRDDAHGKALCSMQARAALCGCTLHELSDGGYLVGCWNCSRVVPYLRSAGELLRQIGGR